MEAPMVAMAAAQAEVPETLAAEAAARVVTAVTVVPCLSPAAAPLAQLVVT